MPRLTKRFIDSIKRNSTDQVFWDSEVKRFGLRVLPTGVKTFVLQYRNAQGRTRKLALGRLGELTPEQARTKALKLRGAIRDGADPSAERHAKRNDVTIAALVEAYIAEGPAAKPTKKASSWVTDASNLRRHVVPLLGRRHLATLTKADVQRFQRDATNGKTKADIRTRKRGRAIIEGGPGTAARATAVLSAMLQWAAGQGYRSDNPARGVTLNKLRKRERILSADELGRLGDALRKAEGEGFNRQAIDIIRLLVLTGARRNEVEALQWEYVDSERGFARLPDSKTGAKSIPLGAPALEVLAAIKRKEGNSWVFPSERGDGHFTGLSKVWSQVRELAELPGVRLHDLRHGFASVAVANGSSLYLVGKVLGHNQASTTQRYAHLDMNPVRAVADQTARRLAGAMAAKSESGNVVPMPGQSRVTVARSPSVVVAALCRQGLAKKLDVPPGNEDRFYVAVDRAIENYREIARPKGHPDSPARAARQYARAGKAAVSGSAIRIKSAVDALTPEQRDRLIEVARASGGEEPVSDEKIALAAVIGSGPAREWSPRRKAKMGVPPLRTRGAVTGGRPSRPEVDVLVASLSTALAIATGRPATRGSKNAGRAGKLIPSKLEQLVSAVQDQLGETGQWNPVDRVRSHIRARDGKPSRQR